MAKRSSENMSRDAFGKNSDAQSLYDLLGWRSISKGMQQTAKTFREARGIRDDIKTIYIANAQGTKEHAFGQFGAGLQDILGRVSGKYGAAVDNSIKTFIDRVSKGGGISMERNALTSAIADLKDTIGNIAGSVHGVQGDILKELTTSLTRAKEAASSKGWAGLGDSSKDVVKAAFGFKTDNAIEYSQKTLTAEIQKTAKALSDPTLKQALKDICVEMNKAAAAAGDAAEKQNALADASSKIEKLQGSSLGADAPLVEALAKKSKDNTSELGRQILQIDQMRKGSARSNSIEGMTRALGGAVRYLIPLKRSLDVGNSVFQAVNSKFNQFARMQMKISAERGAYGRSMRGAGLNFSDVMSAIGTGRRAGMEDKEVVAKMVDLQTELAKSRWGEGSLIEPMGRWGLTPFNEQGGMKTPKQVLIDISRKYNSISDELERLQFLTHMGYKANQAEYIKNYERDTKRWEYIEKNPNLQGVLESAKILDDKGLQARADAATTIELRRRQILNQNAIDEGVWEGFKRQLHPENWFFSDWTARQKGLEQARGEMAVERLTKALEAQIALRKNGKATGTFGLGGLSAQDLAYLNALAEKSIANKGDKSAFAALRDAYKNTTGMAFDTRSAIEKLQAALEPAANLIAKLITDIYNWLTKSSSGKMVMEHPIATMVGLAALFKGGGAALRYGGEAAVLGRAIRQSEAKALVRTGTRGVSRGLAEGISSSRARAWLGGGAVGTAAATAAGVSKESVLGGTVRTATPTAAGTSAATTAAGRSTVGTAAASEAVTRATAKGVSEGVSKGISKQALRKVGGGLLSSAFLAYDVYQAAGEYKKGNAAEGNRIVGSGVGGMAGAWAGAKAGALLGAFGGVPGVIIGGAIGGILGGIGGAIGGNWLANQASENFAVSGSTAELNLSRGYAKKDVFTSAEDAGKNFINALREALKKNEMTRAIELMNAEGIQIDVAALNDEKFLKNDEYANAVMDSARVVSALGKYASKVGKAIEPEDFDVAVGMDKYHQAARQQGLQMSEDDVVNAALRSTGFDAAPSHALVKNYMEKGWQGDTSAIAIEMANVAQEKPNLDYAGRRAEAEKRVRSKFQQNFTQEDYEAYEQGLIEQNKEVLNWEILKEKAAEHRINQYGQRRNKEGKLIDNQGYLIDIGGRRIDEDGRHEGEEGYKETRAGDAISAEEASIRQQILNYRKRYADIDEWKPSYEMDSLPVNAKGRRQAVLQAMKNAGIEVENRTFDQKFKDEQAQELKAFLAENHTSGLSFSGMMSQFAVEKGTSLDKVRGMLKDVYGDKMFESMKAEYEKSSTAKAEKKEKEENAKVKDKANTRRNLAETASAEQIKEAITDEGEYDYYMRLRQREMAGEDLTSNERAFLNQKKDVIGKKREEADKKKSKDMPLNQEYVPTADEEAALNEALSVGARLEKRRKATKGRPALAEMSDLRRMEQLKNAGMSDEQLQRRFGEKRFNQFTRALASGGIEKYGKTAKKGQKKTKKTAAQSREEYEKHLRARLEGAGFSKEQIEAKMKEGMEDYDLTHPQGKEGGETVPSATELMKEKSAGIAQASSMMAAKSDAAEHAAASAKNIGSVTTTDNKVTINMGGQTITQNITGEYPMDKEGMKQGTLAGAEDVLQMVASTLAEQTPMLGIC